MTNNYNPTETKSISRKVVITFILLSIAAQGGYTQVNLLWNKHYNGFGNYMDKAVDMKIDYNGNIVVTGITGTLDTATIIFDIVTIKYTPAGDTLWTRVYNGLNGETCEVNSMTIDPLNNIYLTGFVERNYVQTMLTVKYDPNGNLVWVKEYGAANIPFIGKTILYDNSNAIYVIGNGGIPNAEAVHLIKYNSNGDTLLTRSFSYISNTATVAECATMDNTGNLFIGGTYQEAGAFGYTNFIVVKYLPTGDIAWIKTYDGPINGFDYINVIKTDNSGNVYVSGLSEADHGGGPEGDYATIKYDNSGNEMWIARYDGGYGGDWPIDMIIDGNGFVYVTGWSISELETKSAATVKYNSLGQQQWAYRYNGDGYYFNEPVSLSLTQSNILLVAGGVSDTEYTQDWVLVAINNNSGDSIWTVRYDGSATGTGQDLDTPTKMLIDGNDNIYICGFTDETNNDWDITTIKYSSPVNSINEVEVQPTFYLYPNPTSGILNVSTSEKIISIEVYNLLGEKICTLTNSQPPNTNIINLSVFPKGVYFVRFNINNKYYTKKIILR